MLKKNVGLTTLFFEVAFDEPYSIPDGTAAAIDTAKSEGRQIVAIGTSVVRALESAAIAHGDVAVDLRRSSPRLDVEFGTEALPDHVL